MTSVPPIGTLTVINGNPSADQRVPGAAVDSNYAMIRTVVNDLLVALGVTIRDDNQLRSETVGIHNLKQEVLDLIAGTATYEIDYDDDALAYFERVAAAEDAEVNDLFTIPVKVAVNSLFLSLKSANLFNKVRRMNLFCTNTLAAAMHPAVILDGAASDTNMGYLSADYGAMGLRGGTSKYLKTGVLPAGSGMTRASFGLWAYLTETGSTPDTDAQLMGSYDGNQFSLYTANTSAPLGGISGYAGAPVAPFGDVVPRDYLGCFGVTAVASQALAYRAGESMPSSALTLSGVLSALEAYVGARNTLGTADNFCRGTYGFYAMTTGMSRDESLEFSNIVNQFQIDMGRSYLPPALQITVWGDSLTDGLRGQAGLQTYMFPTGRAVRMLGIGGETLTQIKVRFDADPSGRGDLVILWGGTNGFDKDTVKAELAAMVAQLTTVKFLILMVQIADTANSWIGGPDRPEYEAFRSEMAALYPNNWVDWQATLVSEYNPGVPQDVTDHTHGIVPSTLRVDPVHLNTAGYARVAQILYNAILAKGW